MDDSLQQQLVELTVQVCSIMEQSFKDVLEHVGGENRKPADMIN